MTVSFDECPDIRLAAPEDFAGILKLMRSAAEEDSQHPINEEKVAAMVMRYYNKQGALLAVVGEVGNPVGYVLSIIDFIWYSDAAQLLELSLYVDKEYRKSTYAKQLMIFAKKAAEGLSLDLTIGVFHNQRTDAKIRLYRRQFGDQIGAYFCFRPSSAEQNV
jgi:GNAT superfamily N-acetyltransferase